MKLKIFLALLPCFFLISCMSFFGVVEFEEYEQRVESAFDFINNSENLVGFPYIQIYELYEPNLNELNGIDIDFYNGTELTINKLKFLIENMNFNQHIDSSQTHQ